MSYPSHRAWRAANGPGPWSCSGCGQEVPRLGADGVTQWRLQGIVHHHDGNHGNNAPGNLRVMHHGCHVSHHMAQRQAPRIPLSVRDTIPLHDKEQIAGQLRTAIETGEITDMLPSLMDIAESCNVALGTARRAVQILKDEGLVTTAPGRGTFVRRDG